MSALSLKYTSRVSDLRKLGWTIEVAYHDGAFFYTLGGTKP